ncbi:MAG: hypothetical protein ACRDL3_11330 [Solirubrobacterales bacterium]
MADRDPLERIDRHMARGNELMGRVIAQSDESRAFIRETREFMRELSLRQERVTRQLVSEMQAQREEFVAGRAVLVDLHEESMAQRQAILRLIDELRSKGLGGNG